MTTPSSSPTSASHERVLDGISGWLMLAIAVCFFAAAAAFILTVFHGGEEMETARDWASVIATLLVVAGLFIVPGFFSLQPNEGAVLLLFGAYRGTVRSSGFFWASPFNRRQMISLRARNLNGDKLKVNDKGGNPIEIAAVVVWRVRDTAQASFDVDNYTSYVALQSESAVLNTGTLYT